MKKMTRRLTALGLALCLALPLAPNALATGVSFETVQQSDPDGWMYLPSSIPLKKLKLPLVWPAEGAPLYIAPDESANMATYQGIGYYMRYLGSEGDFYKALTFDGKQVYIKKTDAKRGSQSVHYPVYPAGSYPVGRELTPGVETSDESSGITSYTPGIYRSNSEVALNPVPYYLVPARGKTATLIVSKDPQGKDIVRKETFEAGAVFAAENGQYVTVQNASVYNALLAPSSALNAYKDANPDAFDPGEGYPYAPGEEYAWTDEMMLVSFM